MLTVHNQRVEIPILTTILIVADRRLKAISALMGSTLRRQIPAVKSDKGVSFDRKMIIASTYSVYCPMFLNRRVESAEWLLGPL